MVNAWMWWTSRSAVPVKEPATLDAPSVPSRPTTGLNGIASSPKRSARLPRALSVYLLYESGCGVAEFSGGMPEHVEGDDPVEVGCDGVWPARMARMPTARW